MGLLLVHSYVLAPLSVFNGSLPAPNNASKFRRQIQSQQEDLIHFISAAA